MLRYFLCQLLVGLFARVLIRRRIAEVAEIAAFRQRFLEIVSN